MTREELIVKVAVAIYDGDGARDGAIKAIDIVLEEAARGFDGEPRKAWRGDEVAAAIRALGENK